MRTILFDFDGTVADTLPMIFNSFRSTFQHFLQRHYTDQEIVAMFGPPEMGILENMIASEQLADAVTHFYDFYAAEHQLVSNPPEMIRLLDRLEQAGISMGIVTGKGRRSADISLKEWGLAPYFDVVIAGDEVTNPKPDPEGILLAMEQLGATPEQTIYVGDSNADIIAGKAAGLVTVGVTWLPVTQKTGGFQPEPDYEFTDTDAFAEWVLGRQK
ncbi:HAD-IA family hydrolase [Brevibacillus borstelensis]|jgi:phosphoglycolate phosphatase/pyrophosphatase PpaX|uniref:HAD family hydrolase n=1 Tax=Brevibacillus borstelensis TaxID=45462 RepID=UPI002E1D06ED|nr:HAD-IA family hydrolase [Brevibacillus borstelensis]MED1852130.1 HAD-IA family hydrolase [Brevibacillus borstelensis]